MTAIEVALGDWAAGDGPLPEKLAHALRSAVDRGDLLPGAKLPAERVLARSLAVSRSTVVAALDRLREDGLVTSRHGSGSRVVADARRRRPPVDASAPMRRNVVAEASVAPASGVVELLGAHVEALPELTASAFADAMADLAPWLSGPGYLPLGLPTLREAVARRFSERGVPTGPDQVLITNGAQQGLALAAALFVRPGDVVVTEDPTYLTAIDLFRSAGGRLHGVPCGPDGVDPAALRQVVEARAPALVYLVPSFHNPVGGVLPDAGRAEVAALARARDLVVVEDEALADLSLDGERCPPPIARWADGGTVVTLGTASKVLWGGLRIGWVRAEAEVIRRLGRLKAVGDIGSSLPSQVVAARWLAEYPRWAGERRRRVRDSLDLLVALLGRHLPSWTFDRPRGGLCLWVRLPCGDAAELAQVARRHGVAIVPGHLAGPDGGHADRVRLPLTLPPDRVEEGVVRLAEAWRQYLPTVERRVPVLDILV